MIESMKIVFRRYVATGALALAACTLAPMAHASIELASGSMKGIGQLTSDTQLYMASAGKLTIQVTDLGIKDTIMDRLASLSFSLTDSTGTFASRVGEGTLEVQITNPDSYWLHISAMPDHSRYDFTQGLVSWRASFDPLAPVPLPAGVWLLIAGAAWAIGLQRKRATLSSRENGGLCPAGAGLALAH